MSWDWKWDTLRAAACLLIISALGVDLVINGGWLLFAAMIFVLAVGMSS